MDVSRIGRFPKRLGFRAFGGKNFEAKEVGRRAAKITGGRSIFISLGGEFRGFKRKTAKKKGFWCDLHLFFCFTPFSFQETQHGHTQQSHPIILVGLDLRFFKLLEQRERWTLI